MRIQVDLFDEKSVKEAIKQINKYKRDISKKEKLLLKKLGSIGFKEAKVRFKDAIKLDNASPVHANLRDVSVRKDIIDNRLIITASGEDVAFIEFGAGIRYGQGYLGERPEGIVGIGEYGFGQGKNPKGWWYGRDGKSHHSYGNHPAMAMYYAEEKMIEEIEQIVREVFKS